ncbi:MAG TPA: hypothetical protein VGK41_00245 [Solirubrobacterales bacterium]
MNEEGNQGTGTVPPAPGGDGGGGGAGKPGVDVPNEGRKRGPHPEAGKYVVLAAAPHHPEPEPEASEKPEPIPGAFGVVAKVEADSQPEAKRKAIEGNAELQQRVAGDGVFLAAVPAASWQPKLVQAEQPPPIYKGLQ